MPAVYDPRSVDFLPPSFARSSSGAYERLFLDMLLRQPSLFPRIAEVDYPGRRIVVLADAGSALLLPDAPGRGPVDRTGASRNASETTIGKTAHRRITAHPPPQSPELSGTA